MGFLDLTIPRTKYQPGDLPVAPVKKRTFLGDKFPSFTSAGDVSPVSDKVTMATISLNTLRRADLGNLRNKLLNKPSSLVATWGISRDEWGKLGLSEKETESLTKSGDLLKFDEGNNRVYIEQGAGPATGIYKVGNILADLPSTVTGMPNREEMARGNIASPLQAGLGMLGMLDPALLAGTAYNLLGGIAGDVAKPLITRIGAQAGRVVAAVPAGTEWLFGKILSLPFSVLPQFRRTMANVAFDRLAKAEGRVLTGAEKKQAIDWMEQYVKPSTWTNASLKEFQRTWASERGSGELVPNIGDVVKALNEATPITETAGKIAGKVAPVAGAKVITSLQGAVPQTAQAAAAGVMELKPKPVSPSIDVPINTKPDLSGLETSVGSEDARPRRNPDGSILVNENGTVTIVTKDGTKLHGYMSEKIAKSMFPEVTAPKAVAQFGEADAGLQKQTTFAPAVLAHIKDSMGVKSGMAARLATFVDQSYSQLMKKTPAELQNLWDTEYPKNTQKARNNINEAGRQSYGTTETPQKPPVAPVAGGAPVEPLPQAPEPKSTGIEGVAPPSPHVVPPAAVSPPPQPPTPTGKPPKPPKDWNKVKGSLWDRYNKSLPDSTPTVRPKVKGGLEKIVSDEFARLNKLGWETEVNAAMVRAAPGRAAELYRQTMTSVVNTLGGDGKLIKYVDDYLMLRHQLEVIKATGRKTFALVKNDKATRFTEKQIQLLFAQMHDVLGPEQYEKVKQAASYVPNVYHELLRQSSEVTPDVAEMLIGKYPWYNPIIYEQEGGQLVTNLNKLSPSMVKKLSEYNIDKQPVTPLMSLPNAIRRRVMANAKNEARKAIAHNTIGNKDWGGLTEIVDKKPEGAFIDFFENGQRKYLKLGKGAEWIAKDIQLFDSQPKDAVRRIASAVNKVSRAAFTSFSAPFIVSNTMFDALTAWFREGIYPWDIVQAARHTITDMFTEDAVVNKFRTAGADIGGFFYDETKMKSEFLKAKKNGNIVIRDPKSAIELLKRYSNPFMIIRDLGHAGENAPRLASYLKALKEGLSEPEAALRARRLTVDFARMGQASRTINDFYLFFNAGVQGFLLPGRTLRDNPKSIMRLALFISAVIGLTAYNLTHDEYKDVPDNLKYGSLLIMLPSNEYDKYGKKIPKYITIVPTLREFSLFTGLITYIMGKLNSEQPELYSSVSEAFGYWLPTWSPMSQITGTKGGGIQLPTQFGQTIQELITNQDTYRNKPIIDDEMAQLPAKEQYDQYTSKLAITIGQAINVSPKRLDFFLNNMFGSTARDIMSVISRSIDAIDSEQTDPRIADLVKQLREIPTKVTPENIPLEREKFLNELSVEDRTLVLNLEKIPDEKIPFISNLILRLYKEQGGQVYQTARTKALVEGGIKIPDKALEGLQTSAVSNAENYQAGKITKEQYDKERTRYRAYYSGASTAEWRQAQLTGAVSTSDVEQFMPEGWKRGESQQALSAYYEIRDKFINQTEVLDSTAWDKIEESTLQELRGKFSASAVDYTLAHKDDWMLDLPEPARSLELERAQGIEDGSWWDNYRGNAKIGKTNFNSFTKKKTIQDFLK